MKIAITIMVLLAAPVAARAQAINIAAVHDGTNVATVATGAEYGLVIGAGYGRVFSVAERPIVLAADLTLQAAGPDVSDFRLRAHAVAPIVGRGHWNVLAAIAPIVRGTSNDIARMIDVGSDVAVLTGRYTPRWFVAAEAGFDWALATHIAHTDLYRMQVYADARDGWYHTTGGVFRAGLQGGVTFGSNDLTLRTGRLLDIGGNPTMFPIYATLSYDRRW